MALPKTSGRRLTIPGFSGSITVSQYDGASLVVAKPTLWSRTHLGMVVEIPLNRKTSSAAAAILVVLVLLFVLGRRTPRYIEPSRVWSVVESEAREANLDPRFIFAIAMAESSFNANAETDVARGMMQLTYDTWAETTDVPYSRAYDWPTCVKVGTHRLAHLRQRLEAKGKFTYPRLAAAYRYGFSALARRKYDISRLPSTRNKIYQTLLAGEFPDPARFGA